MSKLQVGANVVCWINGRQWGLVTDMDYNELSPREPEYGLDSMEPAELGPTTTLVTGVIRVLMARDNEMLEGMQVTAGLPYISSERYFSIMLQDRTSGFVIMTIDYASIDGQSWSVANKNLVRGQFNFKGMMVRNHYNQM